MARQKSTGSSSHGPQSQDARIWPNTSPEQPILQNGYALAQALRIVLLYLKDLLCSKGDVSSPQQLAWMFTLPQTIIEVHIFFIQQTWKCTANSGSYMAVHLQNLCANIEAAHELGSLRLPVQSSWVRRALSLCSWASFCGTS